MTNTKKYAILWLGHCGLKNNEICKELKIPLKDVEEVLADSENKDRPSSDGIQKINSKNLMITHTSGKKTNTVAIMTKEASEINDAKNKNNRYANNNIKSIFRPKDQ